MHSTKTHQLHIRGLIQGVGFRPFIYRLAQEMNLNGIVYNQNNGVIVHLQCEEKKVDSFCQEIIKQAPGAATIESIDRSEITLKTLDDFVIGPSKKVDKSITQVSPDIAVCTNCLNDMKHQTHRIAYPFINCTNCGPRFSIIENIPYDRPLTSMGKFEMCPTCRQEYKNLRDRRFHAQPVACNNCGPTYKLHKGNIRISDFSEILSSISVIIEEGGILAFKSLGGYNLVCDAFHTKALKKLRAIKKRDGKPFAIMVANLDVIKEYTDVSTLEEDCLNSWQRPIVLLKSHYDFPRELANGLTTLGIFLPYLPIHYQLFDSLKTKALVMTSANISDCPIIIDDQTAIQTFHSDVKGVLTHNREIVNRTDDSVSHQVGNQMQLIRRSRGYVPNPIKLHQNTEGILATGAELSNVFGLGKGCEAILSQHIGDLKNLETMEFFEQSLERFKKLFEFSPSYVVCDMHPEYLSTKFAKSMGLPIIETQHHHAHIASTMAEYGIDEKVIGIAYDGTGYGTDGNIWGSEIMVADLAGFDRKYHFEYVPIPGGDKVAKEPWRSALSYLYQLYGKDIPELGFLKTIDTKYLRLSGVALQKGINTPESCSAGRLFDAVSALTGICSHASYHAEAPILLEHHIQNEISESYPVELKESISWKTCISEIVNDLNNNVSKRIVSAKFHNTVVQVTFEAIKKIQLETGISTVILSGGSFQNKYLSENLLDLLHKSGNKVYMAARVPLNDGGIALGQLAIAAKSLALCV